MLTRVLVVVAAGLLVLAIARFRPPPKAKPLTIEGNLTGPGVFLFTSETCDSCADARAFYTKVLGDGGFVEITWESDPALLTRLGVWEIPVGTVLGSTGEVLGNFRMIPKRAALQRAARRAGIL